MQLSQQSLHQLLHVVGRIGDLHVDDAAYLGNAAIALPEDECAEEDIDWNKIPVGWHPANEEEAVARIEAIEEEYERTGKATDFDDFIAELKSEGLWLI